jgi:hypothetical protein
MRDLTVNRIIAALAISGALCLFVGTWLHPMSADPNVPLAAFTEYATSHYWVAIHFTQLLGLILMIGALLLLGRMIAIGSAQPVAAVGIAGAIAGLALGGALQAVDGVALKAMVNIWATAPEPEKRSLFLAALAIRQIEIGLASVTSLVLGLTVALFGIALLLDQRFPKWLGILALAGGFSTALAGLVIAQSGFSGLAMAINLPSSSLILLWMLGLGVHVWRSPALQAA